MKSEIIKTITKYAILLSVLYAIQYSIQYFIRLYIQPKEFSNFTGMLINQISLILVLVNNLITMVFVMKDKRKFQIKNRYLEILTLCYRPIGVCVLLIQLVLKNNELIESEEVL